MEHILEVCIGGGDQGTFRVDILRSPAGEASATVHLPVQDVLDRQADLQQAILASSARVRRAAGPNEQAVRAVGHTLFTALLGTGEVGQRYRSAAALAQARDEPLRVVVRIDTPWAAALPWEAMFDESRDTYSCTELGLVRHIPVPNALRPQVLDLPLRILGIVSTPRGLPLLDVEREKEALETALGGAIRDGSVDVGWVTHATWPAIQDQLLDGIWHVVHFIGHGDFDPARDQGVLTLVDHAGRADEVDAHRFVQLLRGAQPMPRLVVLNSCSGAAASRIDLFSGTAATLVRQGVSAVVAMQYSITDDAAIAFSRGFYAALARGRAVDDAVSNGRRAIIGTGRATLEWVTPVTYLRGGEARIFQLPDVATPPLPGPSGPSPSPVGKGQVPVLRSDSQTSTPSSFTMPASEATDPTSERASEPPVHGGTRLATHILRAAAGAAALLLAAAATYLYVGSDNTPSKPSVTADAPVVLTGPSDGASVHSCEMVSGTSRLAAGKTLVVASRNLGGAADTFYQSVRNWDSPERLARWEAAVFFGPGNVSVGQDYRVRVLVMDVATVRQLRQEAINANRQPWSATSDPNGAAQAASVTVRRVAGPGPAGCG